MRELTPVAGSGEGRSPTGVNSLGGAATFFTGASRGGGTTIIFCQSEAGRSSGRAD